MKLARPDDENGRRGNDTRLFKEGRGRVHPCLGGDSVMESVAKLPERIFAKSEPHPSLGGWKNFLRKYCEVRDEVDGVVFFGATNCNYIVFPCGTMVQNFGYHGRKIMNEIHDNGADATLAKIKGIQSEVDRAVACIGDVTPF